MTEPSDTIGPYEVVERLGSGGMATVYKAYQPKLDRHVAIKVMHRGFAQDESFLARFQREARIVARLDHPNIVPVYDYDEHEGQPYLVMKFVEGFTLKDILRAGPLPLEDIQQLMHSVADALGYAHQQGVLHRDIKPSNIIIDNQGHAYLTDFGLARIAQSGESTMSADVMIGTPHYISPEQAQGLPELDASTDVYSLGVILYELVTGRVPFRGESPYAIVHQHIYTPPPPPSELNPEIPPTVEAVLLKALAKAPQERYSSPTALMEAFDRATASAGLTRLDEERASIAAAVDTEPRREPPPVERQHSGKFVTIPAPTYPIEPPETFFNRFFRQVGDLIRSALSDVGLELQEGDVISEITEGVRGVAEQIRTSIEEREHSPRVRVREERARAIKLINDDWGMDETSIRRRARQRMRQRVGLFVHTLIYVVVISVLAGLEPVIAASSAEAFAQPDVVASVGGDFLQPLADFPLALAIALAWGSGLAGHALSVFYNSGGRLERRRRAIRNELEEFYGPDWQDEIDASNYRRTRRSVENRFKRRVGLIRHFVSFLMMTLLAIVIWPPISEVLAAAPDPNANLIAQVPFPPIIALFLGFSVLVHGLVLGLSSAIGADAHELNIQREMARERELLRAAEPAKQKNEEVGSEKAKREAPPGIRLTDDGEFTDSFMIEWEEAAQDNHQKQG